MVNRRFLKVFLVMLLPIFCSVVYIIVSWDSDRQPVLTAEAAIAEARKSWMSIHDKKPLSIVYNKESTDKFEPYTATLEGDVWVVRGTIPEGFHGETLETRVRRSDGGVHVIGVTR